MDPPAKRGGADPVRPGCRDAGAVHICSSGGDRPSESISLNFTQIEIDVIPQNADGTAGTKFPVTYNLQTMTMS